MPNSEPNKIAFEELVERLDKYRNEGFFLDHHHGQDQHDHVVVGGEKRMMKEEENSEQEIKGDSEQEETTKQEEPKNSEIQFLFHAAQFMISNRLKKKDGEKVKLLIQAMKNPNHQQASPFIFPLAQSRKLQKNIIKNFGAQLLNQCLGEVIHTNVHTTAGNAGLDHSKQKNRKNSKIEVNRHHQEEENHSVEEQVEEEMVNQRDRSVHSANIHHNSQEGKKIEVDIHDLYQQSVQSSRDDVNLFEKMFKTHFQQKAPHVFREDFCGTGLLCCEW